MKAVSRYLSLLLITLSVGTLNAQDPRERNYYYEILKPGHEPKPLVEGFATERIVEKLDRGLTAVLAKDGNGIYLNWRLLATDDPAVEFNVYRMVKGKKTRLSKKALKETTDFTDITPAEGLASYYVEAVTGKNKPVVSEMITVDKARLQTPDYKTIKFKDSKTIAGKLAVGDLNGDGIYDYIIRHPHTNVDPGMPGDTTGITYKLEAYLSDGTYLWTTDLGLSIEPGVWYSPFVVYDFNGDGKAEIAVKTGGDDYVKNEKGRVCGGSEYLSILDGMTGKEIARVDWPERNDRYGNLIRQNRNQMGVAYLDGKTPCILAARGTYKLMVVDAWQLNGDKLEKLWRWDGDEENPIVRSQGAHNMVCGDVDGDGRDEILLGSCMLDDNGVLLWSSGLGHSDKAYLTDVDPSRPGMEVFLAMEPWHDNGYGVCLLDARTGERIWGIGHKTFHVGDGMVADIDPTHPGLECFAREDRKGGSVDKYLLTSTGEELVKGQDVPNCRNWIWWDAGNIRQTFVGDDNRWGAESRSRGKKQSIGYWKGETVATGIEGDILMIADLFGDWREEVVTALRGELRIYHTNCPAMNRRITLMQDPVYRSYVIQRSQGYPQAPVPSYYLGD